MEKAQNHWTLNMLFNLSLHTIPNKTKENKQKENNKRFQIWS